MQPLLLFPSRSVFVVFLFLATVLPPSHAAIHAEVPGGLVVDFSNSESRSISVRLGSADGITADMNFAVLDSKGTSVAEFYPHEILTDRFWSGPLRSVDFVRIRSGNPVIRIEMDRERAGQLRDQFIERVSQLKEERRRKRLQLLGEEKTDLEEQINDLDVDLFHLNSDRQSLQEDLDREKRSVSRQVDDLQGQIDDLREDRSELNEEREDLLERRDDLLKRSTPPQDRISDINEEISDLDRDIGRINIEIDDFREEIRDLRDETRSIQEEIQQVRDEQRDLDSAKRELVLELKQLEKEMEKLKADGLTGPPN